MHKFFENISPTEHTELREKIQNLISNLNLPYINNYNGEIVELKEDYFCKLFQCKISINIFQLNVLTHIYSIYQIKNIMFVKIIK